MNDKIGKDSFSEYRVIENFDIPVTLVNIFPKTGRTHQIRVHLSSMGHPIINDDLYGGGETSRINSFHEKNRLSLLKVCNLSKRVSLHASEIEFKHPSNNNWRLFFEWDLNKGCQRDMIRRLTVQIKIRPSGEMEVFNFTHCISTHHAKLRNIPVREMAFI